MNSIEFYNATFNILERNGWDMCGHENGLSQANMTLLADYKVEIQAQIAHQEKELSTCGEYGILWLEVSNYENDMPYSINDLEDMLAGIAFAEDNLLRIGMPFCKSYVFHGKNKANQKRKNEKLRRKHHLDELEEEWRNKV